jgi:hypothetical protein
MALHDLRFESPREDRIHRRLGLVGEGPQAFYQDALRQMRDGPVVESVTHLVGHLLREIEGALRDVLEPIAHYEQQKTIPACPRTGSPHHLRELGINEHDDVGVIRLQIARTGLAGYAHRRALERPRPVDENFRDVWTTLKPFSMWCSSDSSLGTWSSTMRRIGFCRNLLPLRPI